MAHPLKSAYNIELANGKKFGECVWCRTQGGLRGRTSKGSSTHVSVNCQCGLHLDMHFHKTVSEEDAMTQMLARWDRLQTGLKLIDNVANILPPDAPSASYKESPKAQTVTQPTVQPVAEEPIVKTPVKKKPTITRCQKCGSFAPKGATLCRKCDAKEADHSIMKNASVANPPAPTTSPATVRCENCGRFAPRGAKLCRKCSEA